MGESQVFQLAPEDLRTDEDNARIAQFMLWMNGGCTLQKKSKNSDFKVYYQSVEGNPIILIKGECTVLAELEELVEFLNPRTEEQTSTMMKATDTMYTGGRIVALLDDKHKILYGTFKVPNPISDRDFVWKELSTMLDDNSALVLGESVEHPDHPEKKGMLDYVRGKIFSSGYHVKANGDGSCFVTYLVSVDPQGWLPPMITNLLAADQAENVKRLRNHFAAKRAGS